MEWVKVGQLKAQRGSITVMETGIAMEQKKSGEEGGQIQLMDEVICTTSQGWGEYDKDL